MDGLDLLKKKWHSQDQQLPLLTYEEIYAMLVKRSSSIVKWIFYISIGEILLWSALSLILPETNEKLYKPLGLYQAVIIWNIVFYSVFIFFIILFYRNYQKIKTTDSVKELMKNILRTRKTVKCLIFFNIIAMGLVLFLVNLFLFFNQDLFFDVVVSNYSVPESDKATFMTGYFIAQIIVGILLIGLIVLFYRIIYGILLRRLHQNYHKLKEIED